MGLDGLGEISSNSTDSRTTSKVVIVRSAFTSVWRMCQVDRAENGFILQIHQSPLTRIERRVIVFKNARELGEWFMENGDGSISSNVEGYSEEEKP